MGSQTGYCSTETLFRKGHLHRPVLKRYGNASVPTFELSRDRFRKMPRSPLKLVIPRSCRWKLILIASTVPLQ